MPISKLKSPLTLSADLSLYYTGIIQSRKPKFVLVYGGEPVHEKQLEGFDAVINVSDSPGLSLLPGGRQVRLWFPIVEAGQWAYSSLFGFKRAMDALVVSGSKVYVHCHAGTLRGPTMCALWLRSVGREDLIPELSRKDIEEQTRYGRIPADLFEVFAKMKEKPEAELADVFRNYNHPQCISPITRQKWLDDCEDRTFSI